MEKIKKIKICKYKSFTILIFAFLVIFPIKILLAYNSEKTTERVMCNDGDIVCLINDSLSLVKKNIPDFSNLDNQFEIKSTELPINNKINLTATVANISLPLSNKVYTNSTSVGSALTSVADDLAFGWNFFIKGLINNFVETKIALNQVVIGTDNTNTDIIIPNNNTSKKTVPSIQPPNKETPKIAKNQIIPPATQITKTETKVIQGSQGTQGLTGLVGPQGPKGESGNSIDVSNFVSEVFFSRQVSRIFDSISESIKDLSESLADEVETKSLIVSGDANINGDLTITGNLTGNVVGVINPSFTLGSIPFQGVSGLTEDNINLFWDSANSRLGVGTSTPTEKLNVAGNISATGSIGGSNLSGTNTGDETNSSIKTKLGVATNLIDGYLSSTDWTTFNNKQPAGNYLTSSNLSGLIPYTGGNTNVDLGLHNLTVDTNTLFVDSANHRVGIGTISPTDALTVTGNIVPTVSSGGSLGIPSRYWTTSYIAGLNMGSGQIGSIAGVIGSTDFFIKPYSSSYSVKFMVGNTEYMRMNGDGNIGIGTTNPSNKLHIQNILSTPQILLKLDSDSATNGSGEIIHFTTSTDENVGVQVGGYRDASGGTGSLRFSTYLDGRNPGLQEAMRITGSGNVGIGTTNPQNALDINGRARFIGDSTNATSGFGVEIFQQGGTNAYIQSFDRTAAVFKPLNIQASSINLMQGNVGIGTTNPLEKLHISAGNLIIENGQSINFRRPSWGNIAGIYANYTTNLEGFLIFQTNNGSVNSEKMRIDKDGNVGIGTTAPNQQLEITKNFRLPTTTGTTPYGIIYKGSSPFISDFSYGLNSNSITPTGNNIFIGIGTGNLTTGSTATVASQSSLNTVIGTESFTSNTTGFNNTSLGYRTLTSNTTGNNNMAIGILALYSNTTGTNNTAIGRESLFANVTSSNNTANGAYALSSTTAGNNTASGYASMVSNTTGSLNTAYGYQSARYLSDGITERTTGNNGLYLGGNSKASDNGTDNEIVIGYNAIGQGSNTVTLGNTNVTKTLLNGNVGIGTTNPISKLHILDTTSNGDNSILKIAANNASGSANLGFSTNGGIGLFQLDYVGNMVFRTPQSGMYFDAQGSASLHFRTTNSNTERMTILNNGNIGVGNTSPSYALHVVGTVGAVNGIFSSDGYFGAFKPYGTGNDLIFKNNGGTELVRIKDGGNVGIGTTSPSNILTAGFSNNSTTQSNSAVLNIFNSDSTVNNMANISFGQSGSSSNGFSRLGVINTDRTSGSEDQDMFLGTIGGGIYEEKIRITSVGNVGIGTINPTARLEVLGFIKVPDNRGLMGTSYGENTLIPDYSTGGHFNRFRALSGQIFETYSGGTYNEKMRLTDVGNLGIGTTNPIAKLQIGPGGSDTTLSFNLGATNTYSSIQSYNSSLALNPSGNNVGIGTTSPAASLEIKNSSTSGYVDTLKLSALGAVAGHDFTMTNSYGRNLRIRQYNSNSTGPLSGTAFFQESGGSLLFLTNTASPIYFGTNNRYTTPDMTLDASGNIGIGTTAPGAKLEIVNSVGVDYIRAGSFTLNSNGVFLNSSNMFYTGGYAGGIYSSNFRPSGVGSPIAFMPYGASAFSQAVMVINTDTAGNVGIGTTSPVSKLEVISNFQTEFNTTTNGGYGLRTNGPAKANEYYLYNTSGGFRTAGGNYMFYSDTAGRFATGSNTGLSGLYNVIQSTTGSGTVATTGTTTLTGTNTSFLSTFKVGDTVTVSGETARIISTIVSDTILTVSAAFSNTASGLSYTLIGGNRFAVMGNGNVGIGTTSPSELLDIAGISTAGTSLRLYNNTTAYGDRGIIKFNGNTAGGGNTNTAMAQIVGGHTDIGTTNYLDFKVGVWNNNNTISSTMMRINSSGNVGIGTTTPTGKLHVVGSSTVATDIIKLSAGSGTFFVNNVTSNSIGPIIDYDINASATITNFIRLGNGTMATGATNGITQNIITSTPTISTASNSTTFNVFNIAPTVNQTGTANGITRGIYVNPTLTAASDFRAIETNVVSGTGRYGYYGAGTAISYFGGNVGIGTTGPTAVLHLKAGTATAGTAPIKLTAGTVNTTPEAGAMEYDGTNLYFTPNTTRETISTKTYTDTKLALLVMGDTKEISGFVDGSNIDISYNHTNRTVTLTGNLDYYWRGVKYTLTSPWTSTAHTNSVGSWYLSTTDGTNFTWSNSPWSFSDAQVAFANYQSTAEASFVVRETHGLMDSKSHELFHSQVGTYRYTGGQLTAGTYTVNTASDAANSPGFDPAVIKDEDLSTTIPTWTEGTYTTMYVGASDTAVFNTTATLPFISAGSYLQVNNSTTGSMTNGINNRYYNVYQIMIPVGSNSDSQKYRMVMLQPQATHTSLASATAEDVRNLKFGNLSSLSNEFIVYSRITYITGTADANTGKARIATGGVTYVVGNRAGQVSVSGFTANDHASLSNLTWLTSGHLGNVNTVPAFNASGVATELTMTGTGTALALATTPTFTTNITTPLVLGGSTTTSDLNLQTTSGVGATGADMHFLVGNNGATEAMTILNGGNVGIGTTNPTTLLQVGDSSNINNALINLNSQSNTDAGLIMNEGAGNVITGTGYGFKLFYNGVDQNRFIIQSMEGAGYVDRLAINRTSGNVGIGNTSPSYQLQVGNNTVPGIVARFENSTGTCDINPTTASLACSSDISLKKNITTLENSEFILNENINTSSTSLEKILALTPVLYNWNNENDSTNKHVGFIAQEVEQVFPDLVFTDQNTTLKSISYTNLIPYTVKAIQEMDLIVKELSSLDTSNDNSLGSLIAQFLAEQATFAKEFTANIFHVNGDVCVDDVCITKEEFKQMLINAKGTANTDVTTPEIEVTTTVLPPPVATPPVEIENPPVVENEIVTNPLILIDTDPVITPPIETVTEPINDTTTVLSLPESPVSDDLNTMPPEN